MQIPPKLRAVARELILAGIIIFVAFLIPKFIGLSTSGLKIQSVFEQFTFYLAYGAGAIIGLLVLSIASIILYYDSPLGYSVLFNAPGEFPAIEGKFFKSYWRQITLAFAIFAILGLFSTFANVTFTGVGALPQTFTVIDNSIFTNAMQPAIENIDMAFLFAFTIFILRAIGIKYNWSKLNFRLLLIPLLVLLGAGYGYFNHQLNYVGVEIALVVVVFFWAVGALVTSLSGSFIIFWIAHISNNSFDDLKHLFSADIARIIAVATMVVALVLFILTLTRKSKSQGPPK